MLGVFKSKFLKKGVKNSLFYSSASTFATVVNFLAFIYYSRELGPTSYGIYNIVVSFVSIVSIFSFTGMNKVILRSASINSDDVSKVYNDSYGIRLLFVFIALIVCFVALPFTDYSGQINTLIAVFSISIFVQSFNTSLNAVTQAKLKYGLMSIFILVEAFFLFGLSVFLLRLGLGVWALIISQLSIPLFSSLIKFLYLKNKFGFSIRLNRVVHKDYLKQGFNFSLLNNLNVFSSKIDLFMLSILASEYIVGIYAVAFNLVSKIGVLRNSVIISFFPLATKKINQSGISKSSLFRSSLLIAGPVFIIAFLFGFIAEEFIVLLVGIKFKESADFLVLLIYRVGFDFLILPIGLALQASFNERVNLLFALLRAILNIFLNIVLFNYYGTIGIAYSTLVTTSVVSVFILFYGYSRLKKLKLVY